ncbi:hypothetical protein FOMPIDRAFT_1169187 [Fomitopsis schrenkii]|uniref:Carboxylesterase type B domain-containing protein n=1 Tax=Fomitopsis schrenkii TaxID=2126942 RepID=S8F826_FOMSC|nr:hypothetical protein FOMPIDRAFT_1169187 [Fomitopsis schrenkii]
MHAFLFSVLALAKLISATNDLSPVIDLGYAQYQGSFDSSSNISYFLGVRYAQPPTGELRWRAPQTPTTTAGVQQATEQPNECYQSNNGLSSTNPYRSSSSLEKRAVSQDEDCLFLNVYTPGQLSPVANLPVLVWIHGGGYIAGAASSFSGEDIIKESGYGVVAVIIQYRLGVFGFLPGSEVLANGTLNAGLLDQNFALQWVQEHIASFGGDPTQVTIWGESAGAGSVIQHIIAHGGQTEPPLFRAAMTSSTFLPFQYYYNDTIPEALFSETVAQTNCSSASDALACLRAVDVSTLQAANTKINVAGFYGTFVYVPVIDGTFIIERPTVTLEKRRVNGEMLLSVTNGDEGYIFVDTANPPTNLTNYVTELFPLIDPTTVQTIVQQYEDDPTLTDVLSQAIAVMGESIFVCPTYLLMGAFGDNAYKAPDFAVPPATHGEDLAYYFPTAFDPAYNNSELITAFSQSFLSVVRSMNPNDKFYTDLKPEWSVWQDGTTEMLFNVTSTGGAVVQTTTTDPSLLERCAASVARHINSRALPTKTASTSALLTPNPRLMKPGGKDTHDIMRTVLVGVLALWNSKLAVVASDSTPTVDLGYAQYRGAYDPNTNISSFLGIRYAQPPTGDLRWRAPQTPVTTAGIQEATRQPNECYQGDYATSGTNPHRTSSALEQRDVSQDEDCLFLNVYAPGELQPLAGADLPVLVWIHGGGYANGAASQYAGEDIVNESDHGVVVVIIQYRMGLFGFLPGSEVFANGTLNVGLLDQNFALQWVQQHITSFGGDPAKVTIWGESAGAGSVIQHIVAHRGQTEPPLFRAAMTSSTYLPSQYFYNDTIPEALFSETVALTNCSSTPDALACLRSADASTLQAANTKMTIDGLYGTFVFVAVIDGTFIVERPTVTLEKRRVNGDILLSVTNGAEGDVLVDTSNPPTNLTEYVISLFPLIDPITAQTIVQQYKNDLTLTDVFSQASAIMAESIIVCPTYMLLEAFGGRAYKGEFAVPPARHGDDLHYYFPTAFPPAYDNSQFITAFSQSFLSIVRSLDPNVKFYADLKPEWSVWQNGTTEMLFNVTSTGEAVVRTTTTDPSLLERCT